MDTAKALHHTLNGIVELCRHLLATGHDFVMLGEFSNDPIEREFGKLRQGTGGANFLSAQQMLEKLDTLKMGLIIAKFNSAYEAMITGVSQLLIVVNVHVCQPYNEGS